MNDLPPVPEKILIFRKEDGQDKSYHYIKTVSINQELWNEMENQMDHLKIPLKQFVNQAFEYYLNELKEDQAEEKRIVLADLLIQASQAIDIKPKPKWAYNENDK